MKLPLDQIASTKWALTGAFAYWKSGDIADCCRSLGDCFRAETSCYRAVYLPHYLETFAIEGGEPAASSWTLGAVLCRADDCLRDAGSLPCRWRADGCAE